MMDSGATRATEISMIKFVGARVLHDVLDRAIQVHGALGFTGTRRSEAGTAKRGPRASTTGRTRSTAWWWPARFSPLRRLRSGRDARTAASGLLHAYSCCGNDHCSRGRTVLRRARRRRSCASWASGFDPAEAGGRAVPGRALQSDVPAPRGRLGAVLRRPPLGPVAPRAHDMAREFHILERLHPRFPLAPQPYGAVRGRGT